MEGNKGLALGLISGGLMGYITGNLQAKTRILINETDFKTHASVVKRISVEISVLIGSYNIQLVSADSYSGKGPGIDWSPISFWAWRFTGLSNSVPAAPIQLKNVPVMAVLLLTPSLTPGTTPLGLFVNLVDLTINVYLDEQQILTLTPNINVVVI